jgi:ABC-type nitrate/sulfonate/bicarbonate transport system substrate-binding protein
MVPPNPVPLRLALEWFLNPDHLPFLIARDQGWLAEAGIDLQLIEPAEHFDAFAAMQRGEVDVAITEPIHLLQDLVKGEQLVGFARFLHTNGGVLANRAAGIERPADMAGKRVQYPGAPGPGGLAIVRTMILHDDGVPGELTPVNCGFQHTTALLERSADVATLVFYNFEVIEARHRGLDGVFFALKDWGVPDFCQLILVALPQTLEDRREQLDALLRVLRRGIDLIKQQPALAREIWRRTTGADPEDALGNEIFDATVPCFTHDFSMAPEYYDQLAAWLIETDQADLVPEPAAAWTNALVL